MSRTSRISSLARLEIAALALFAVWASALGATETDPFTGRITPIADSTELLNVYVNGKLETLIASWRYGRDELRFENEVYRVLGGAYWVDKIERWARRNPEVAKLVARYAHLGPRSGQEFGMEAVCGQEPGLR